MVGTLEISSQAFSKMAMHAMKYPHCICSGFLLSPKNASAEEGDKSDDDSSAPLQINEAIPVSHASHCLSPFLEAAYNAVSAYAEDQDLVITGYYQTDKNANANMPDIFGRRVTEMIGERCQNALLCCLGFEDQLSKPVIVNHQFSDGKWRNGWSSFRIENDPEVIADNILYTKENLYRKIVDFDEHFNNISLDWTNSKIGQRIDTIITNVC